MSNRERNEAIAERRRQGESCVSIAKDVFLNPKQVSRIAVSMGVMQAKTLLTPQGKLALDTCQDLEDKEGVVKFASLVSALGRSISTVSHSLAKLTAQGLLVRTGSQYRGNWKLTEEGRMLSRGIGKLKIRVTPERLAQSLSSNFRATIQGSSPIDSLLPYQSHRYDIATDDLIKTVQDFISGRFEKE